MREVDGDTAIGSFEYMYRVFVVGLEREIVGRK